MILHGGDTKLTYKFSDFPIEYQTISYESYATAIGEFYAKTTSVSHTKVASIHYQALFKKETAKNISGNNLPFTHSKVYC